MLPLLITVAVLSLIALLLMAPVRLSVLFEDQFSAQVRYLFFRFSMPSEEQEQQVELEGDVSSTEERDSPGTLKKLKALLRREGLGGFLQSLKEVGQAVETASSKILKKVKLNRFDLYVCLGGKTDAAEAAILYGQVSGLVYGVCGILFGVFPCKKKWVTVDLDYGVEDYQVKFSGVISIPMLFILKEGLILLLKVLPFFKKLQAVSDKTERISRPRKQGEIK